MRESGARDLREVGVGGAGWRRLCGPTGPKAGTTQNQAGSSPNTRRLVQSPESCTVRAVCFVASVMSDSL